MTVSLVARARVLAASDGGSLSVEPLDAEACRGCHCGRFAAADARAIRLDLGPSPRVLRGEELTIAMPARELLRAAVWMHGLPWLGLVAGSAAGAFLGGGDFACLLGAAAGLVAALALLRWTRDSRDGLAVATLRLTRTSCER